MNVIVCRALLRPGRFDVEVQVFPPDLKGRCDILEHYLSKVKVADVDTDKMARSTTGCTGADLENMVNQAALKAAMDGDSAVTMVHMEFARDKVLMGIVICFVFCRTFLLLPHYREVVFLITCVCSDVS